MERSGVKKDRSWMKKDRSRMEEEWLRSKREHGVLPRALSFLAAGHCGMTEERAFFLPEHSGEPKAESFFDWYS